MGFLAVVFLILLFAMFLFSFRLKNDVKALNARHEPKELKFGSGKKSALVVYQPTKHGAEAGLTMALADYLAQNGYTVTVNYPSHELKYILSEYDLLALGSGVCLGRVSPILSEYIMTHPFKNKKVLMYTVGRNAGDLTDLNELKILIDAQNNEVHAIKVSKEQEAELIAFVRNLIDN